MLAELVAGRRVHDFARAFAGHAAGNRTDRRSRSRTERTGDRADRRAAERTGGGTATRGEIVLVQLIAGLRIHDFRGAFAGKASSSRADRRAGRHADGAGHCTDCGAAERAGARTDAGAERVIVVRVACGRIHRFGHALAGQAAGHRADERAGHRADGSRCRADRRAGHARRRLRRGPYRSDARRARR